MLPANHNIKIKRGDSFSLFARIRDKVWDPVAGAYVAGPYKDLTGWVGLCQLRETHDSADVVATATISIGNQGTVPGSFFMTLTKEQTAAIAVTGGVYDVQFTTPAGEDYTHLGGVWELVKDVSRLP